MAFGPVQSRTPPDLHPAYAASFEQDLGLMCETNSDRPGTTRPAYAKSGADLDTGGVRNWICRSKFKGQQQMRWIRNFQDFAQTMYGRDEVKVSSTRVNA